jgi:diguanylate cyclase (GGDEF)-like protein
VKEPRSEAVRDPLLRRVRELEKKLETQAQRIAWLERALEGAQRDPLTGLTNHGRFWSVLEAELTRAERHHRPLALVMLDVDHLKQWNDAHGHLGGDRALAALARLVRERCRASDCAARYGGDELAVILPETRSEGALAFATELCRRIEGAGELRASLGVAAYPEHARDARALVDAADAALYRAKAAGRGRVCRADGARA